MTEPALLNTDGANDALKEAVISSYLIVCNTVKSALQTHLGAQHTLNTHRQAVLALQTLVQLHRDLFRPEELDPMNTGINEMLTCLSSAVFSLADPLPDGLHIQVAHRSYTGRRGRPRIELEPTFLQEALTMREPTGISRALQDVSARTVRRRALEFGLRQPGLPVYAVIAGDEGPQRQYHPHNPSLRLSQIGQQQLDAMLVDTLVRFPEFGRNLTAGSFAAQGYRVSRDQLREAYQRVQGGPAIVGHRRIARREYHVRGPNSLWHHDGQHGLIRWKIVVHMFIDGKSRFITAAKASNNNLSATVLDMYTEAIQRYGRPSRVRGDYGVENVGVAANQESVRGRGTYIWGRSIHNTRIERLWVDYGDGVKRKWWTFFEDLEVNHGLNIDANAHLWLLHTLFLQPLNDDIARWVAAWNHHPMQLPAGERNGQSPREQFFFGMIIHGPRGFEALELETIDNLDGYGVDWEAAEDPGVRQHLAQNNPYPDTTPEELSTVIVEPPTINIEADLIDEFMERLGLVVDLNTDDMDVRRHAWIQGLLLAETMETERR